GPKRNQVGRTGNRSHRGRNVGPCAVGHVGWLSANHAARQGNLLRQGTLGEEERELQLLPHAGDRFQRTGQRPERDDRGLSRFHSDALQRTKASVSYLREFFASPTLQSG